LHLSSQTDEGEEVSDSEIIASAIALPVLSSFDGIEEISVSSGLSRGEDVSGPEHI
jgi:hypothetical protein